MRNDNLFVVAVIGIQNAGKTTLVEQMIACWSAAGKTVGALKRDGHVSPTGEDDWEKADSDTRRMAAAGAALTMVTGGSQALLRSTRGVDPDAVETLIQRLAAYAELSDQALDGVVVEGYKHSALPKVVRARRPKDLEWLAAEYSNLGNIVAIVCSEETLSLAEGYGPVYHEDDISRLCRDLWR